MLADILIGAGAAVCVGVMVWQLVRRQKKGCGCCSDCASKQGCPHCEKRTENPPE
ncbi:MAG: FeoB-associated Cys-rich membrane protein [Clostridiales bacterium]|nr:FeoB-associated Cys-rich membrane protein [Clostridiales bacterium]